MGISRSFQLKIGRHTPQHCAGLSSPFWPQQQRVMSQFKFQQRVESGTSLTSAQTAWLHQKRTFNPGVRNVGFVPIAALLLPLRKVSNLYGQAFMLWLAPWGCGRVQ